MRWIDPDDRLPSAKMTSFGGMYSVAAMMNTKLLPMAACLASIQYEYDLIRKNQVELFGSHKHRMKKTRKPYLKKLAPLGFVDYGLAKIEDPIRSQWRDITTRNFVQWAAALLLKSAIT